MVTHEQINAWMAGYLKAWASCDPSDIAAIFAVDAEQHEWPYETDWVGLDAIVEGWASRAQWQEDGWSFNWSVLTINGDTFAIDGTGTYTELGTFKNLWVVTLDNSGQCTMFRMWNNES